MKSNNSENDRVFTTATSVSDSKAWVFSLILQLRGFLKEWRTPSPRAPITAAPLEVRELWTKSENHLPGLLSLLAHAVVLAIAITYSVASYIKPKPAVEDSVLIEPYAFSSPYSGVRTGGGGGMRVLTPASRGVLPRAAEFQLVPLSPLMTNMTPDLIAEPTIIDVVLPNFTNRNLILQLGDPNGVVGPPSGGRGSDYGIGDGDDHGVGNRSGPSAGLGDRPGPANSIVSIGVGGASPPSCPIPASEPIYTDDARKGHIQGTVVLDVVVNKDGTVSVSRVAQKLGYGLDDEASRFVAKSFRCKPGVYQGQAVATPVRIDVNFHLY